MVKFHLLTVESLLLSFSVLYSDFFKCVVISLVVVEFLLVEMNDLVACYVQEFSSMRYNDDCVFTVSNVVLKPHDCIQI